MKYVVVVAAGLALAAFTPGHQDRRCRKLFTVEMGRRAALAVYHGKRVSRRDLRMLGRIEMCQRDPRDRALVRRFDRLQARLRYARRHPLRNAVVSWYDDSGQTASGWHAQYGVADCGTDGVCYRMGTRIEFCYHGCVVAIVDDHGPYVSGRDFDLGASTARAIGFDGVDRVEYRPIE